MAYFCDYMSFLLSLQQKIMLCMKQEKTIYKGYFTNQANIIGYATYKVNSTAADAILDRIVHTAQRFELKGDSLRKKMIIFAAKLV